MIRRRLLLGLLCASLASQTSHSQTWLDQLLASDTSMARALSNSQVSQTYDSLFGFVDTLAAEYASSVGDDLMSFCGENNQPAYGEFFWVSFLFLSHLETAAAMTCVGRELVDCGVRDFSGTWCILLAIRNAKRAQRSLDTMRDLIGVMEGYACVGTAREWLQKCRSSFNQYQNAIKE